jgi:hypothetical protein
MDKGAIQATIKQQYSLKVPSGQIGSAWEWYHWKAL